jgi:hypothetical protein
MNPFSGKPKALPRRHAVSSSFFEESCGVLQSVLIIFRASPSPIGDEVQVVICPLPGSCTNRVFPAAGQARSPLAPAFGQGRCAS